MRFGAPLSWAIDALRIQTCLILLELVPRTLGRWFVNVSGANITEQTRHSVRESNEIVMKWVQPFNHLLYHCICL